MPTQLKGRRAFTQFGFASNKLWGLKAVFEPIAIIGQRLPVAGGEITANKLDQLGHTGVNIPDPYLVFVRIDDEGATLPRYVGRAGELFENAIGTNHGSQALGVPFNCYAAPHPIGNGYWTNPLYDAVPVIVGDTRLDKPVLTVTGGIEIYSKHPIIRYVPYASTVLTHLDTLALPSVGVCPLGERTIGVFEFLFHIGIPSADPIGIITDTQHMDAGAGHVVSFPAAPAEDAYILFTHHICPTGRGEAMYLQVFSSANYEPRIVYLQDWGATFLTQPLTSVDPAYVADNEVEDMPLPTHMSSFARIADDTLIFIYNCSSADETRIFKSIDEGTSWAQLSAPLPALEWTGHAPVGYLVGGPSLLTCFGEGCVMFSTEKDGLLYTWYTIDSGVTWAQMNLGGFDFDAVVPAAGPTVILPYIDDDDMGELVMLVRNTETNGVDIYVTTDLGAHWGYRGPADFPPSINDPQGFNQHIAYVGTYDAPAPIIAGRPGMMELAA